MKYLQCNLFSIEILLKQSLLVERREIKFHQDHHPWAHILQTAGGKIPAKSVAHISSSPLSEFVYICPSVVGLLLLTLPMD